MNDSKPSDIDDNPGLLGFRVFLFAVAIFIFTYVILPFVILPLFKKNNKSKKE